MIIAIVTVLFVVALFLLAPSASDTPTSSKFEGVYELTPSEYFRSDAGWSLLQDEHGNINLGTVLLARNPSIEHDSDDKQDDLSDGYIGTHACAECHQENYDGFIETAHFKTSAEPSAESIKGPFEANDRKLRTQSPSLTFEMLAKDNEFFQRVLLKSKRKRTPDVVADIPIGLVTGSGKIGQTYLYWQDDFLYQHHVSYLTEIDAWANSPGLEDGTAVYARPVGTDCLECHTTYFQAVESTHNKFSSGKLFARCWM